MSMIAVAKKDFKDGIRSRTLIGLVILFTVFLAGAAYFFSEISSPQGAQGSPDLVTVMGSLFFPTYLLLPIVGTLVGFKAIVGERESGSLKFLLGLPHSRRDVVFGKLLGRSGIVTVAVLIGYAVGGIVLYMFTGSFAVVDFLIYVIATVLLGVTFVSIAIAFSSATQSSSIATAGAITLVFLFLFAWNVLLILVNYAATEFSLIEASSGTPNWFLFLQRLNPTNAYSTAVGGLINPNANPIIENPPFYLEYWFGFIILVFWLVVPISLASARFQRVDL